MKEHILSEIRRLAAENHGRAPGKQAFAKATGITPAKWTGVHWVRWSDALTEAGLTENKLQEKLDTNLLLKRIAEMCRELGRLPRRAELKMLHSRDASFPSLSAVSNHFPTNADLVLALRKLAEDTEYSYILSIIPILSGFSPELSKSTSKEGWVYLLKSGSHFKVGRSDNIESRVKSISISLPESVTLVHAIRTDDPPGIEAYWHRRFADRRANGEWFTLTQEDVKVFVRRTFQ